MFLICYTLYLPVYGCREEKGRLLLRYLGLLWPVVLVVVVVGPYNGCSQAERKENSDMSANDVTFAHTNHLINENSLIFIQQCHIFLLGKILTFEHE